MASAALTHGDDHHRYEFFCECSDLGCVERIELTMHEYGFARADPARFVMATGHERSGAESVIEAVNGHVFVEKDGAAGQVAAELNEQ